MQLDSYLSPYTQKNFIWIKVFNVKREGLDPIKESIGHSQGGVDAGKDFMNGTICSETTVNNWQTGRHETIKICKAKETTSLEKRRPTEQDIIFARCVSDKGLITRVYKDLNKQIQELKDSIKN